MQRGVLATALVLAVGGSGVLVSTGAEASRQKYGIGTAISATRPHARHRPSPHPTHSTRSAPRTSTAPKPPVHPSSHAGPSTSAAPSRPSSKPTSTSARPPSSHSAPTTAPSQPSSGLPGTSSFPSAADTGVPDGVKLQTVGSITVTKSGTVLQNLNITGALMINASNVTVRNSRVTTDDFAVIRIKSGMSGVLIDHVEVNGLGTSGSENSMGIMGPATITWCDIHGTENGVTPESGSVLKNSYIHSLGAPGSPHYDGVQIDGGLSNITIEHNTVLNGFDQTSAVMIDNYFGPISDIVVNDNLLGGGGYTVYSDGSFNNGSISGVVYSNNRLRSGYYGYSLLRNGSVRFSGNVDDATSRAVQP